MHIRRYINLVHKTEVDLVKAFKTVADTHGEEVDVYQTCVLLSSWSQSLADGLEMFAKRYKEEEDNEPDRLTALLLQKPRKGSMALLRDLHDLYLVTTEVDVCCTKLKQAATGLGDKELLLTCEETERQTKRQLSWLLTRMKSASPQILIVAE